MIKNLSRLLDQFLDRLQGWHHVSPERKVQKLSDLFRPEASELFDLELGTLETPYLQSSCYIGSDRLSTLHLGPLIHDVDREHQACSSYLRWLESQVFGLSLEVLAQFESPFHYRVSSCNQLQSKDVYESIEEESW